MNISYNINEDELNLEKKIFEFNSNFVDNLSSNKNPEVEDFIHNCKNSKNEKTIYYFYS